MTILATNEGCEIEGGGGRIDFKSRWKERHHAVTFASAFKYDSCLSLTSKNISSVVMEKLPWRQRPGQIKSASVDNETVPTIKT